jgi:hypothetical protein
LAVESKLKIVLEVLEILSIWYPPIYRGLSQSSSVFIWERGTLGKNSNRVQGFIQKGGKLYIPYPPGHRRLGL